MSNKIIKNYKPSEVVRLKNAPVDEMDITEWNRLLKISKICYNVDDDCVFEITKGNKKWIIPLDKFFDKVIEIAGEEI